MAGHDHKTSDSDIIEKSEGRDQSPITTTVIKRRPWWKLGGEDISFAAVDSGVSSKSGSVKDDLETNGINDIHGSVFDNSSAAQFYQPIEKYEGRHRFDPTATWTPQEEQKLVRTVSYHEYFSRMP